MNPIYFFDPGDQFYKSNRRNWDALEVAGRTPPPIELTNNEDLPLSHGGSGVSAEGRFVCIVHWTRFNTPAKTLSAWAKTHSDARFIAISGGPIPPVADMPENLFCYSKIIGKDFNADLFKKTFLKWYDVWSTMPDCGWDVLDGNVEGLLAFRLLCAAKRETLNLSEKQKAYGTEFTIFAPESLSEWLKPFGEYKAGKEIERIEEVASLIASGPIRSMIVDVFRGVGRDDLLKRIGDFESALAEEARKQLN